MATISLRQYQQRQKERKLAKSKAKREFQAKRKKALRDRSIREALSRSTGGKVSADSYVIVGDKALVRKGTSAEVDGRKITATGLEGYAFSSEIQKPITEFKQDAPVQKPLVYKDAAATYSTRLIDEQNKRDAVRNVIDRLTALSRGVVVKDFVSPKKSSEQVDFLEKRSRVNKIEIPERVIRTEIEIPKVSTKKPKPISSLSKKVRSSFSSDEQFGKRVEKLIEREQNLQKSKDFVYQKLSLTPKGEVRFGDKGFFKEVGKAAGRLPFELASLPVYVGGRVGLVTEASLRGGESREGVKPKPLIIGETVLQSLDPRTPEGFLNLALIAVPAAKKGAQKAPVKGEIISAKVKKPEPKIYEYEFTPVKSVDKVLKQLPKKTAFKIAKNKLFVESQLKLLDLKDIIQSKLPKTETRRVATIGLERKGRTQPLLTISREGVKLGEPKFKKSIPLEDLRGTVTIPKTATGTRAISRFLKLRPQERVRLTKIQEILRNLGDEKGLKVKKLELELEGIKNDKTASNLIEKAIKKDGVIFGSVTTKQLADKFQVKYGDIDISFPKKNQKQVGKILEKLTNKLKKQGEDVTLSESKLEILNKEGKTILEGKPGRGKTPTLEISPLSALGFELKGKLTKMGKVKSEIIGTQLKKKGAAITFIKGKPTLKELSVLPEAFQTTGVLPKAKRLIKDLPDFVITTKGIIELKPSAAKNLKSKTALKKFKKTFTKAQRSKLGKLIKERLKNAPEKQQITLSQKKNIVSKAVEDLVKGTKSPIVKVKSPKVKATAKSPKGVSLTPKKSPSVKLPSVKIKPSPSVKATSLRFVSATSVRSPSVKSPSVRSLSPKSPKSPSPKSPSPKGVSKTPQFIPTLSSSGLTKVKGKKSEKKPLYLLYTRTLVRAKKPTQKLFTRTLKQFSGAELR